MNFFFEDIENISPNGEPHFPEICSPQFYLVKNSKGSITI